MKVKQVISFFLILSMMSAVVPVEAIEATARATEAAEPELLSLTVEDAYGTVISLLDGDVTHDLGERYIFTATMSDAEQIEKLYIVSTKGAVSRFLEAKWNGSAFVTEGIFDGLSDYTPGQISVQYTKKRSSVDLGNAVDWASMQESLGDLCTATVATSAGELLQGSFDIFGLLESESKTAVDFWIDVYEESTGADLDAWLEPHNDLLKMTKYVMSDEGYELYLDYSDPETYVVIVWDISGNRYVKMFFEHVSDHSDTLRKVAENLNTVHTASGLLSDLIDITQEASELRRQVYSDPRITSAQRDKLNTEIDAYQADRNAFALLMTALPAIVAISGGTMAGPALAFNALLGVLNAAADTFWSYRVGMIAGSELLNTDFMGDAHGIPLTREVLEAMGGYISQSGTYYMSGDSDTSVEVGSENNEHITVKICVHYDAGAYHYGDAYIDVYKGSSVEIVDCIYQEDAEGSVLDNGRMVNVENYGGTVTVESGCCEIVNYSGDVIINGGHSSVENESGGVILNDGYVGDLFGAEDGSSQHYIHGGITEWIVNNGGYTHIDNDAVVYSISNDNGEIEINGGQIGSYEEEDLSFRSCTLQNRGGKVTVRGGQLVSPTTLTEATVVNESGSVEVYGGEIKAASADEYAIYNEGTLIMRGGTVSGIENRSSAKIFAGTVNSEIINSGALTIAAGDFSAKNTNNLDNYMGTVTIEGGNFYCEGEVCISNDGLRSFLTINDGEFHSLGSDCIANESSMEINAGAFYVEKPGQTDYCVENSSLAELVINGGAFQNRNCQISNSANLTINDGSFASEKTGVIIENNRYGNLTIESGSFQGTGTSCIINNDDGKMTVNGGNFQGTGTSCIINNDDGKMTVNGGNFSMAQSDYDEYCIDNYGILSVNGGSFSSDAGQIGNSGDGELTINDGIFHASERGHSVITNASWSGGGKTIIKGGTFYAENDGTVIENGSYVLSGNTEIENGTFYCYSRGTIIENWEQSTLTVKNGTFYIGDPDSSGTAIDNYDEGEATILDGTFYIDNQSSRGVDNAEKSLLTIQGGTFYADNRSDVVCGRDESVVKVTGGVFQATGRSTVIRNNDNSTAVIDCGTFTVDDAYLFDVYDSSGITINGGSFQDVTADGGRGFIDAENENVIITSGRFTGSDTYNGIVGKGCTLLIDRNSVIEIEADEVFDGCIVETDTGYDFIEISVRLLAKEGYDGAITWFDSKDAIGEKLTIEEAASRLAEDPYILDYLRLEAESSLGGSTTEGVAVSINHASGSLCTGTITAPDTLLPVGTQIIAATYQNGQMLRVTSGVIREEGAFELPGAVQEGSVLYFLNDQWQPLCEKLVLEKQ